MKKLIIQSDDLGITKGVTDGIIEGIKSGMIRCTGLFANMESSEYAANRIKDYPDVCLGQDINIVAGKPCANPSDIPCMVNTKGEFLTSGEHRNIDLCHEKHDHLIYEQCLIEVEAQILRFKELTGKLPEYLHGHSYSTPTLNRAIQVVGNKYGVKTTSELKEKFNLQRPLSNWNKKPFDLTEQINANQLEAIMKPEYLMFDIGWIVFHCGYVDAELFEVSTYTLIRPFDLKAATSKQFRQWIETNDIQLISYRDLL